MDIAAKKYNSREQIQEKFLGVINFHFTPKTILSFSKAKSEWIWLTDHQFEPPV